MNGSKCYGLIFKNKKVTFEVCYSHINKCSDRVSIKGIIKPEPLNNKTYAFFQFYREINCKNEFGDKWTLDKNHINGHPYYCLSSDWDNKFSDKPKYDCNSGGIIIFNTFIAEVDRIRSTAYENWRYKLLLGFSWGMMSNDGTKIEEIPIQNIDRSILKELVDSLQSEYPEANFEIENNLIEGNNSDITGMW